MVVRIDFGRRVPISPQMRVFNKLRNILGFQEHLWVMVKSSMKKMINKSEGHDWFNVAIQQHTEGIGNGWKIDWLTYFITCDTEQKEEEEYKEALLLYSRMKTIFKQNNHLRLDKLKDNSFRSKIACKYRTQEQLDEYYEAGMSKIDGDQEKNNIAKQMLEVGIISNVKKLEFVPEHEPEKIKQVIEES